ncbi:Uma2 family endonuclease [Terriglobus sp.]|uniref:Uma2 family endonuclease n=1 Tax=Terriglobus sp. TaxID=1889013 RepID=UPI003B002623
MATAVSVPVEEYLSHTYRPDRDYVNGKILRRHLGERWHASVQLMISMIFGQHRHEWGLVPLPEQRVQVKPDRYRVPDICVVRAEDAFEPILKTPPVLCVEILSTKDRFSRILARVEDYVSMGVQEVWIIDPRSREVWTIDASGRPTPFAGEVLTLNASVANVPVAEIFALIDEAPGATHDERRN